MLTEAQIRAAENGLDPTNQARARGLTRRGQWPGGVVPYTIHSFKCKYEISVEKCNIFGTFPREGRGAEVYCSYLIVLSK